MKLYVTQGNYNSKDLGSSHDQMRITYKYLNIKFNTKNITIIMTWESIKKFFFSLLIHVPLALDHTYFFFFGLKSPGLQYFPFKAVSFPHLRTWQILLILQVSYSNKPSLSFHPPLDIPLLKTLSDFASVVGHPLCCTIFFFPCHPHEYADRRSCTLFSSIVKNRPLV